MVFTSALVVQKIVSFLYFWFLSWRLVPEQLGLYIWSLSITTLFSIGVDLGLSPLLTREAARDATRREHLLRGVLALKLLFGIGTLILLFVVMFLTQRDLATMLVVLIASLVMIFDSFAMSFWSVLRAAAKIQYESFGILFFHILVFSLGTYLLTISASPIFAIAALAIGSFLVMCFAWLIVRFRYGIHTAPFYEHDTLHTLLRLMPAFAAAGIFVRIYNAADTVLLGYLIGNEAVGLYSVPAKVVTALQTLVPGAFMATIYPAMSYYFINLRPKLGQLFERAAGYLLIVALPAMAGLLVLIPRILISVWPAYRSILGTFMLMTTALPFLFLTFTTGYLLNAANRERQNTANRGFITLINVALNLALIPTLGVFGAGIAFLVSNVILLALDFYYVREVIPVTAGWLGPTVMKSVAASAVMTIVLVALPKFNFVLAGLLGFAVYSVLLILLRVFSSNEIAMIRDLFRRREIKPVLPEV